MAKDEIERRRQHLERQLGLEVAGRLSRVDYLRILRAERDGRLVHITQTTSRRLKVTSSLRNESMHVPARKQTNMRFVGQFGSLATALSVRTSSTIARPPGHQSLQVLQFLFSQRTYDRLFAQIATDEREEHAEALSSGQQLKARWIETRIHLLLVWAAVVWMVVVVGKQFWSLWRLGG